MTNNENNTPTEQVSLEIPEWRLGIVPLKSTEAIGKKVDDYLVAWRKERVAAGLASPQHGYSRESFIIRAETPRFGSGEGKGAIKESVRGNDLYLLVDVCNYSIRYRINQFENVMSPDDHFQDLKRVIGAIGSKAHRINVIMPYLYEGRLQTRTGRESLDAAHMLQELTALGVENVITFEAHDPRVQNAVPLAGFESMSPAYQFIKAILRKAPDLVIDDDHLMVVSPDKNGMRRAIYMANVLGVNMGMFYKVLDYTRTVNGSHPITDHAFLGTDVAGKDIIIVDDMISSGSTVLETARMLTKRGAGRIFICATFGMFTTGLDNLDEAYKEGCFTNLITTNLVYQRPELFSREYYISCDMSKYLALIIDTMNHDGSLSMLLDPVDRIHKVLDRHRRGEKI
ncbi:MAG: ribose-phosphate pyrophosphokinase [Lachnospiraceae bacterium]|nr:ribose-phosphate pyrophosphokinase [Lachnospiraceae bacterium]